MFRFSRIAALCACLTAAVSSSAQGAVAIEVWHSLEGNAAIEFSRLAQQFNDSQADYVVMPLYRGTEREAVEAAFAAQKTGQGPHLLQVDDSLRATLSASPKAFVPLQQVMERAKQPFSAKFMPLIGDASMDARGRLVSLPFTASTPVLFFNKDALKEASIGPEEPLRTWLNVQAVALKLADSGVACPFTTEEPAWLHVENLLVRHNEPFATGQGRQQRAAFNTRLMILHIGLLSSWVQSDLFRWFPGHDEAARKFAAGECAILAGSSDSLADIRRDSAFELGVAPLPMHDDFPGAKPNVLPRGASLWVMSGRKAPEYTGAAKFLAWLSQPEAQAQWHQATGYLPVTQAGVDLSREQGYYDRDPEARIAVQELLASNVGPANRFARAASVRSVVDEELAAVWTRRKTPMEGVADALDRANKLLFPSSAKPTAAKPTAAKK
jgi:sn-glycerol 3-phosphate transport system substrate-binding protein